MPTPNRGRRHRLVLYTYIVNHFWRTILGIGIVFWALVAAFTWLPRLLPEYPLPKIATRLLWQTGGVGTFAVFLAIFLFAIRKSAYVQPCDTYLRMVTPFLRMNISYRRFRQASSVEMGRLFPPENFKGQKRAYLRPLSRLTAIVLELNGWPLPRRVLDLFLSPFFFPDKTARIALLVPDWMRFSNEMESFRSACLDSLHKTGNIPQSDLLASLSNRR